MSALGQQQSFIGLPAQGLLSAISGRSERQVQRNVRQQNCLFATALEHGLDHEVRDTRAPTLHYFD